MYSPRLKQLFSFLTLAPNDPETLYMIAYEFHKAQEFAQATQYYQKLLENHPNYLATYYHFGALLLEQGKTQDAIQTYEQGIQKAQQAGDRHTLAELKNALMNAELEDDW